MVTILNDHIGSLLYLKLKQSRPNEILVNSEKKKLNFPSTFSFKNKYKKVLISHKVL